MKLKTDDFDKYVGKDKHVIIEFYAQYCGYCRIMNDEWDKLAEHYMGEKAKRSDVIIAKMDGANEKAIATRYGVTSFPTILFFKKGNAFPTDRYMDMRTFGAFQGWIERQAGPEENESSKNNTNENKEKGVRSLVENSGVGSEDLKELKVMLNEINIKLDNKVETVSADINFGQGLSFLLLGVFLGVGISFTIMNYQKLGSRKKLLD